MRKKISFILRISTFLLIAISGISLTVTAQTPAANPVFLPFVSKPPEKSWPMAGANVERTSWTPEQVSGSLYPVWYKQFEPYIPPKVQIIAANQTLYISTASGLYALDANSGAEKWVYATEMPLGDSPTIYGGVAYVGGLDRRLHAVNAITGQGLWQFTADGGFSTTPLVVNGIVYIGCRDGYFYAIHADGPLTGQLFWKFKTDGPIDYGAAYKDGTVFFASNDSYAYALNALNGSLVWKSAKLPGAGFHSWWPVIYRDWVIFSGSNNYRTDPNPGDLPQFTSLELQDVYPNHSADPAGTLVGPQGSQPGDWAIGTPTIDASRPTTTSNGSTLAITKYLESKPWRRTYFVLNRATGAEYTSDFDHNGLPEYAPMLWFGTQSGNRYPPVIGSDGIPYQANNLYSDPYIARGTITGWQVGSPYLSLPSANRWLAVDEPMAVSAGGDNIYWNICCDRQAAFFNIKTPRVPGTEKNIFSYNLETLLPGYYTRYYPNRDGWSTFGGRNGIYGPHGDQNPPIPYQGKVYMHRSNAVIAFAPTQTTPVSLPMAQTVQVSDPTIPAPGPAQVRASLAAEVDKILNAGHLRPGYQNSGIITWISSIECGDNLGQYWSNPADTVYVLARALPYLSADQQTRVRNYLKTEFTAYPLYQYTQIGWKTGAAREAFDLPPEVEADRANFPAQMGPYWWHGWTFAPQSFYAMWQYALLYPADAKTIFDKSKNLLGTLPADSYLTANPHVFNAYIAGYKGYLELQQLAGYPVSTDIQNQYNRLLALRAATFTKDGVDQPAQPYNSPTYCRGLNVSRNFIYLVPELGQYLHDNALSKVQQAVDEYEQVAPEWFVTNFGATYGEGATAMLYDYHALFQAKALILQQSRQELASHLDAPSVAVGDLFYIDNLVETIKAEGR